MSETQTRASRNRIIASFMGDEVWLRSDRADFKTPYAALEFDPEPGAATDRVVWCCLTELGWFASQADLRPSSPILGTYSLQSYVRGLEAVLGPLDPWIAAMETDLGTVDDLEWGLQVSQKSAEPWSPEFELGLLPVDEMWDELYRLLVESKERLTN